MEYFIAKEASQDLDEILDYFLVSNINAGERFIQGFNKKCQNIAQFPNIGRSYANFDPSLRGIPLDGYIIFYRVFEDSVVIVRVVSGYRDLKSIFADVDYE
ncbi:plasmid stabilization protein [Nostoc sp. 'Peltigera membranacea cyanobiont' 213]|uniref:type II toxin-antitoxin system RelE/ParE family toxin n=1 Tax=unclassified Nostoc TaxID=2593658 RepID=UPI000B95B42B|nr:MULTISPECIES: type II toxin-antitoxin system RelE/ParE family toxin [unclassified Nostoc]AVH62162.1 plasmid stabilization system protein ParE [Nostoc sp. 'Peltigera membranacea cyanobiont' N6]OYD89527.1 plasmid stabilization protein [Nostoc sp. 'Peltigera membranacea cyanobiont' 213]